MKNILQLVFISLLILPGISNAQSVCSEASRQKLESVLSELKTSGWQNEPINEVVVKAGKMFLNTPYVEKTLEVPGDEPLVIDLVGLDCTTYLETVVTLARMTKKGEFSMNDYEKELELLRYRNGQRQHYPSRLHYFSDWIYDNQQKGIIKDITHDIGGVIYENHVGFMSANPKYYAQLSNESYVEEIRNSEEAIAARTYYYIPKEQVAQLEKGIHPGDLIAITLHMDNLDIAHVGFAVNQNGRIHLMHASSSGKKVMISEKPLSDYLAGIKKHSGIMVCRLLEP